MFPDYLLITGASSDLGCALLDRLGQFPGPDLVAHSRGRLDRLHARASAQGQRRVHVESADLSSAPERATFLDGIQGRFGTPLGIVQYAALPLRLERFSKWDPDYLLRDFELQVMAQADILRRFLPDMARAGRPAKVVFVLSSVTFGVPKKFLSMYTTVKYAQLGLMKALAAEFAGSPLCINAVSPDMVETGFLADLPGHAVELNAAAMPHKRNLQPQDLVPVLEFLLGPGSDGLTGVNLPVTGGSLF